MTTPLTPTITVTPAASTSVATSSLSVKVTVTGSGATPSGTVTLSGGGYTSAATALSGGIATIVIPANSLSAGNNTLTASYSGDANYAPATGGATGTAPVTVSATPLVSTVTVTPAASTLDSGSTLSVPVAVTGAGVTSTGTVTLSGGGYTSTAETLVNGSYTFVIPANSLSAGTDTLTASYSWRRQLRLIDRHNLGIDFANSDRVRVYAGGFDACRRCPRLIRNFDDYGENHHRLYGNSHPHLCSDFVADWRH